MKSMLDSTSIEVPCPHCSKNSSQSIGVLKVKNQLTCRHCRHVFLVDATKMRTEIAKIERELAKIKVSFDRLGK